jgi:hypothetical protein
VLSDILNDHTASARHRIESARELRQTAAIGSETAPIGERYTIRIDLSAGGDKDDVIVVDATPLPKIGSSEKADDEPGVRSICPPPAGEERRAGKKTQAQQHSSDPPRLA